MGRKKLPPGFVYDRPVPSRWAEDLAELAPPSDVHPWLLLAWMSGDPWEERGTPNGIEYGVQRWVIYEMIPLRIWWGLIQAQRRKGKKEEEIWEWLILDALSGPHPRDLGHYDEVLGRFVSEAECTRQEWELFRQHKAIPMLYWLIQGQSGGHKRCFTPQERQFLALARLPQEPPCPGALPYAGFDQRVLFQLAKRDRLKSMTSRISPFKHEQEQQLIEFRRQLVQWVEDQQRAALEEVKLNIENIPRSSAKEDDPTEAIERRIDRFIQTGSLYPQPKE